MALDLGASSRSSSKLARDFSFQRSMPVTQMGSGFPWKVCPHVQDWGQVCGFQGKNRRGFGAFTTRVRIFSAKFAGSGNAFEHSAPNLQRIMSTEFTKTVGGDSLLEQLSIRLMILLLKIEGNCSHLRAKSAHFVRHLPAVGRWVVI